jgi:hypothetical protein
VEKTVVAGRSFGLTGITLLASWNLGKRDFRELQPAVNDLNLNRFGHRPAIIQPTPDYIV